MERARPTSIQGKQTKNQLGLGGGGDGELNKGESQGVKRIPCPAGASLTKEKKRSVHVGGQSVGPGNEDKSIKKDEANFKDVG